MELVEGEDLSERISRGRDLLGRGDPHRAADRRGPRGGARAGHRPPRSQTGQHQAPVRRDGQGARLRARQGVGGGFDRREPLAVADHDPAQHGGRADPRHRRLHVARAGPRPVGRSPCRYLGLRGRGVGDADRPQALRGRDGLRCSGVGAQGGAVPRCAAARDPVVSEEARRALSRQGLEDPAPRHRRGADCARPAG